jgi:ferredoxin-NADP reductase
MILPVGRVEAVTPRARRVWIDLGGRAFPFLAGQSVELGTVDQRVRKPYSIACSPGHAVRSGTLEFLIQFDHDRGVSPHLVDLAPGRLIDVGEPAGSFVWRSQPEEPRVLFVAGGTGIAPVRSMLWQAIEEGYDGRIVLVHSARFDRELAFAEEFRRLGREGRIEFHTRVTRQDVGESRGDTMRFDRRDLASFVAVPETRCYLCGPASLVEELPAVLGALGVAPERIHTESWRERGASGANIA